jgi:hypothetical protein
MEQDPNYGIDKPLERWNTSDFVRYYMRRFRQRSNNPGFVFPKTAWLGYGQRVNMFKRGSNISNTEYKEFIDYVFDYLFKDVKTPIAIGVLASKKVFYIFKKYGTNATPFRTRSETYHGEASTGEEFERLRQEVLDADFFRMKAE